MPRREPAFTILELLTVIAILALLISILIPSLSAARRSAKANVCISHLKGIGNGFIIYLNENEDRFPPYRLKKLTPTGLDNYVNGHGRLHPRWQWFIETDFGPVINPTPFNYLINNGGYFNDVSPPHGGDVLNARTMAHNTFACPALDDDDVALDIRDGAYGYNYQYLGNTRTDSDVTRWDNFAVSLHLIRNPSMTILVGDSRGAGRKHGRHSFTLDPPRMASEKNARAFGPSASGRRSAFGESDVPTGLDTEIYAYSPVEARHNKLGNVVFGDTHAEAMTLPELGYQLVDPGEYTNVPEGTPFPIQDPYAGSYTAGNKLWTGDGSDPIAHEHRP